MASKQVPEALGVDGAHASTESIVSAESLLENGLSMLRGGAELLHGKPTPTDLGRALREVASGTEAVLKSFLAAEDWTLVFDRRAEASEVAFRSGDFFSVGAVECVKRLRSLTRMSVPEQHVAALERMRKQRNRLEHLCMLGNVFAVRAAIGGALHSVASLVQQAAETGLLPGADETLHTVLAIELSEIDEFVNARWDEIRAKVPDGSGTCPACSQTAAEHDGDWACHFCGTHSSAEDVAEAFLEHEVGVSAYSVMKDGGEWPLHECPSCEDEALVELDGDGYRCFSCDETFDCGSLTSCTDCGRLIADDGEAPRLCSNCFSNKFNSDD